jgi:hypothetical protein
VFCFISLFILVVRGFELRASRSWVALYCLSHIPILYSLVIFEIGSWNMPGVSLDQDPPICASHIAGIIDKCHYTQPLVEMGSHELFSWSSLEPGSS